VHIECNTTEESHEYFEKTIMGLDTTSKEASIDKKFSQYLYKRDDDPNKVR
jgi:hypothetical protein